MSKFVLGAVVGVTAYVTGVMTGMVGIVAVESAMKALSEPSYVSGRYGVIIPEPRRGA